MQLELKHLAPYLPYGLKWVKNKDASFPNDVWEMRQIHVDDKGLIYGDAVDNIDDDRYPYNIDYSKPILRPLSDLTDMSKDFWIDFSEEVEEMNTTNMIISIVEGSFYALNIHKAFEVREVLFKMHFDVFGLIDQGLAIDINTINP